MKLPHLVIVKSPGLLPMLYKSSELASELAVPERTLRDWLNSGAPYQRDKQNHIWINGSQFRDWVTAQRKPKREKKLDDNQAYCLHCRATVQLRDSKSRPIRGRLILIQGICPDCGTTINRGASHGSHD
jgi:hypothetical protein